MRLNKEPSKNPALTFQDYEAGLAAVVGGQVVPLDSNAIGALAQNAMMLALSQAPPTK